MRRVVRNTARLRRSRPAETGGALAAPASWRRRGLVLLGLLTAGALPAIVGVTASSAAPVGQGFEVTASDLSHILRQIKIAERHVAVTDAAFLRGPDNVAGTPDDRGICDALVGPAPDQVGSPLVADGLRTVDGSCNNLIKGNEKFGAEGQVFPRLASPLFKDAEPAPPGFPSQASSSYAQTKGFVYDSQPRTISNLIVDQTSTNPAAVAAAGFPVRTQGNEGVNPCVTANEVQTLSGTPNAPFTLSYEGQTTGTLPVDATAAQVRTALVALSNIGPADVAVSGGPLPGAITITFKGALAATNVSAITSAPATDPVTGLDVATTVPGTVGVNEQQTLTGTPSAAFSIQFGANTTGTLPLDATDAQVQAALEALPNIGPGNVAVAGGQLPATLTITFQGTLAETDVDTVAIVPASALSGLALATTTAGDAGVIGCVPAHQTLFIPNVTTDVGLSPPFNSLFTIFGQFFDHGVDKTAKGGSGTVFIPLKADDPLIAGPDHVLVDDPDTAANEAADNLPPSKRFMPLSRATNQPGPDGVLGDDPATPQDESADDVHDANNTDTPFVDQSQTYTSHPSHQAFLREYSAVAGKPVNTGKLINGAKGGQANWAEVKAQAANLLGLQLTDQDVLNIPMIAADFYGNLIPGPNGFAQWVRADGTTVEGDPAANGGAGVPAPANVKHFQTAFLDDIAHTAVPDKCDTNHDGIPDTLKTADANNTAGKSLDPIDPCQYDDELLDLHFIAGDGRVNENIALTAVHQIFHSEHNRLVDDIQNTLNANPSLLAAYQATSPTTFEYGERLFHAARFVTEMEYQHLVFEEFARKIQPLINPFAGFAFTQANINPAVRAEFAHAVYRFGHSMLTETISRTNEDGTTNDIGLLEGFLNPASYFTNADGSVNVYANADQAGGAILMGMSDQTGNEIDEFVTETLRNNLLGLPLDLPSINMTRARSEGIPPLNVFRKQVHDATNDSAMQPYTSWVDWGLNLKHPESLVNFIAAYGTDPTITGATTLAAKRAAAQAIMTAADAGDADALAFMNGPAADTGVDAIDLWVGGLAERTNLFGGLLGNTFNYVFEGQLTDLQNSDRLYYLGRTPGMNLRSQLEGNSFAELVMRNTTAHTLKADAFATADCKFELGSNPGIAGNVLGGNLVDNDPASGCDETALLIRMGDGTIRYRTTNTVDPPGINGQSVYNGTAGVDRIFGGVDNDTFLGNGGNDIIEGGDGADVALGGEGNDRITDNAGDDVLKGGPGNDTIEAGPGLDIIMGGAGKDFMNGGANINEIFAGPGDDFLILGAGEDAGQGDGGDDWMEGGDQPDLLQGDSGTLFFTDRNAPGHDVTIGQAGDDDYDVEGGDDIMVADPGIEKNAGAAGWDWSTGARDLLPQNADLNLKFIPGGAAPVPPQTVIDVRDRFNEVEALSGGKFDDALHGDDFIPSQLGGGGFIGCDAVDQASLDRIAGLDTIITPAMLTVDPAPILANTTTHECHLSGNVWGEGNVLIGGPGSDVLEGRGANDVLDGDKYLDVRLSVRTDPADPATEIGSTDLMEHTARSGNFGPGTAGKTLEQAAMSGLLDPGNIVIVREILSPPVGDTGIDVALFSDAPAAYDVTDNGDGSFTVVHARPTAGVRTDDGTDLIRNIETLRFCTAHDAVGVCTAFTDRPVVDAGAPANDPSTGAPVITGTPQVGSLLTAGNGDIADSNPIVLISFNWQMSGPTPGSWVDVASGAGFTPGPDQIGRMIRVVATVLDNQGGSTNLASTPIGPVAGIPPVQGNTPATGQPVILDIRGGVPLGNRPRVNDPLGVDTSAIQDDNGLGPFNFRWQQSADGTNFADIPGATDSTFIPTDAQIGLVLRLRVFFVDQGIGPGTPSLEIVTSDVTRDVRPARGGARALTLVAIPRTLTARAIAARGLPVSFTAPSGTRIVRVTIVKAGSKRVLARAFVNVKAGKVKLNLRTLGVRRALGKAGTYRVELTPGVTKTQLGRTTVRTVVVR